MYGSPLLDETVVAEFEALGMRFIERTEPEARDHFWYQDPHALLISPTGTVGYLRPTRNSDTLQVLAIHTLVDELQLAYGKQVSYGSKSSTVLRVLREASDALLAKGYDPATLGAAFGIYGSLGVNKRAGRSLMSCVKAAQRLVDLQIDAKIFYRLLDQLRGSKCLERTVEAYRFVTDPQLPPTNMSLVRELFSA